MRIIYFFLSLIVLLGTNVKARTSSDSVKILLAYYSRTGNTQNVANQIHEIVGGDMVKIETVKAYPTDHDSILAQVIDELYSGYKPALSTVVDNIEKYDLIIIGHPIWWGHMPPPMMTFVSSYDFSGKRIAHFCTYSSSKVTESRSDLVRLCPNSIILESLAILGTSVNNANDTIRNWLGRIGVATTITQKKTAYQVLMNPTHDHLSVTGDFRNLTLLNIKGMEIYRTNEKTMDISNLPAGFYLVKITCADNRVIIRKTVK